MTFKSYRKNKAPIRLSELALTFIALFLFLFFNWILPTPWKMLVKFTFIDVFDMPFALGVNSVIILVLSYSGQLALVVPWGHAPGLMRPGICVRKGKSDH